MSLLPQTFSLGNGTNFVQRPEIQNVSGPYTFRISQAEIDDAMGLVPRVAEAQPLPVVTHLKPQIPYSEHDILQLTKPFEDTGCLEQDPPNTEYSWPDSQVPLSQVQYSIDPETEDRYFSTQPSPKGHVKGEHRNYLSSQVGHPAPAVRKPSVKREAPNSRFMCRISNPTEQSYEQLQALGADERVTYLVVGPVETHSYEKNCSEWREASPTTPHLHFYFELNCRQRSTAFIKPHLLAKGTEIQPARGTAEDCRAYCLKNLDPAIEIGQSLKQSRAQHSASIAAHAGAIGVKHREDELKKALEECPSKAIFAMNYPHLYARNCHGIDRIYQFRTNCLPAVKPHVEWHFGPPRSGKTFSCLEAMGGTDNTLGVYYHSGAIDWISKSYSGQKTLFFNDFRKSGMKGFNNLLALLEGYPGDLEVKGDHVKLTSAENIIITCPRPPKALSITLPNGAGMVRVQGEFELIDKYGPDHGRVEYEDVDQVIERIREGGGCMIYHWRTWDSTNKTWVYDSMNVMDLYPGNDDE